MPGHAVTNAEELKEAALYYARDRGWAIFPTHGVRDDGGCTCPRGRSCGNLGKQPRTENGYKDATDDLATIEAWWEKWPGSNIGMPTGP
ncbi:MAG: bifunctional DNA primase/polymerase, partial [Actinomycetota bacterium]|nr:bifunctional DNA primase/polymerase [Actinomycetota bacterium]